MISRNASLLRAVREFAFRSSYGPEPRRGQRSRRCGSPALSSGVSLSALLETARLVRVSLDPACTHVSSSSGSRKPGIVGSLAPRQVQGMHAACVCAGSHNARSPSRAARSEQDPETQGHIRAAIDAIENGNHNFFVDREHSGMVTLRFSSNDT